MAEEAKVYIGKCKVAPEKKNRCVIILIILIILLLLIIIIIIIITIIISIIIILLFNHLTKLRLAGMPRETTPPV